VDLGLPRVGALRLAVARAPRRALLAGEHAAHRLAGGGVERECEHARGPAALVGGAPAAVQLDGQGRGGRGDRGGGEGRSGDGVHRAAAFCPGVPGGVVGAASAPRPDSSTVAWYGPPIFSGNRPRGTARLLGGLEKRPRVEVVLAALVDDADVLGRVLVS